MAKKSKWQQKAFGGKPGALHKKLGVPEDQTIPQATLKAAYREAKRKGDTETMRQINAMLNAGSRKQRLARKYGASVIRGVTRG